MHFRSGSLKFLKNGISNVISGSASALLAVVLPYFFVRNFGHDEFSLWILVLQLAALVNFLNFGVQVAVGRYVAHWLSINNKAEAENVLTVGLQILAILGGAGVFLLSIIGWLLPVIFSSLSEDMIATARSMLIWIGGALCLGLPFSAFLGVFVGVQRNDIPAIISLISKGGLAIALILAAHFTHNLQIVAVVYCAVSLVGYAIHFVFFKAVCPDWKIRLTINLAATRKEVVSYCISLTVWSVASLLMNGVSASIVSIFAFKEVAALGVALNAVAFFSGMFRSFQSPMLQVFAKLNARGESASLLSLFDFVSYATSLSLIVMSSWLILPARPIFYLWVGPQIAPLSIQIFVLMVIANAARNSASTYATYLLAIGEQRKVYITPFAEGVANFVSSILFAKHFGAAGVAWGACVGSAVGVASNFVYNFKRTMPSEFSNWRYFQTSIWDPVVIALPMYAVIVLEYTLNISLLIMMPMMLLATAPAVWRVLPKYRSARDLLASGRVRESSTVAAPANGTVS